jgi:amino acid adenylation domain-containing protein
MTGDLTRKIADVTRHYAKEREYWLHKLAEPVKSIFPYDYIRDEDPSGPVVREHEFRVSGDTFSRLVQLSTGSDHTLHIILAAALALLLRKYGGDRDIILGTPVYKQVEDAQFINTVLPLRIPVNSEISFKELLLRVKDILLEAGENQNYPVEKLVDELNLEYSDGDFPLFDVSLLVENIHDRRYIEHIRHNMTFSFLRTPDNLEARVAYNTNRYAEGTVERIAGHFMNLLNTVVNDLDQSLARVGILSEAERRAFLVDYNQTAEPCCEPLLHQLFEPQAAQTPDACAVAAASSNRSYRTHMTYSQLNHASDGLAGFLQNKGVGPDTIVAIKMERSIEMIIAILGILKAGGAYMPIDPNYPEERIKFMLEDSGAKVQVTARTFAEVQAHPVPRTPQPTEGSSNLAYVIYTSGTTGRPKGVMLEHRGVVNYITWAARTYVKNETAAFPLYTGISFDLTVTSIFTPLVTGNTIYIYPGDDREFLLDGIIRDDRVGVVKLTPAHLKLLKDKPGGSGIRRFILGGENLETASALEIFRQWDGNIEIYNEYGPTETVVGSMIHRFDPAKDVGPSVPIGVPIAGTQVYLLDPDFNPVPVGVPGEIYISGAGVGRGYLNRPELTAERFVDLNKSYRSYRSYGSYEKLYRTGDLAKRLPDGTLEYLGRIDQQVKIRGFRVELGEVESRLRTFRRAKHTASILEEKVLDASASADLKKIVRCSRCLLSANHPGIRFDSEGVCNVCREYEGYETHVKRYFKTPRDLEDLLGEVSSSRSDYDCLLLFSGGKDSTYTLYRLIDMGLKVLTYTFDNGYISQAAFENIRRTTSALNVEHITGRAEHMNPVFVESLETNHNVCHGCWNALNTYGAKLAHEKGINIIVSGLSRGQIFDMRLHGLFQAGIFDEQEIEENLLRFRKGFHSPENKFSRILGESLEESVIETVQFVDFFRYDATPVEEIKAYLSGKGWVQPADTGFCSSNCRINDVGIYMYLKERGAHFYEAPLSWDVRLGQLPRESGLEELGFDPRPPQVDRILNEIGYYDAAGVVDAVVLDKVDKNGNTVLCAYVVSLAELTARELREYLAAGLPDHMIPAYFVQVEGIPLSASGKTDRKALLAAESSGRRLSTAARYVAPRDDTETAVAAIFKEVLKTDRVGMEDNFFELGATSFEIIRVSNRLTGVLGRDIPVLKLFEHPTIASFLEYVNRDDTPQVRREADTGAKWEEAMNKGKSRFEARRRRRN